MKFIAFVFVFLFLAVESYCQDYPYDIVQYNFVDYSKNKLLFGKDSSSFERLFAKIDTLIFKGKGEICTVQIGASHTQADIFSNQVRYRFQNFQPGMVGARGFVFPYRMSKSNNPSNYSISYTGFWSTCRNVEWKRTCQLGLSGIAATTYDRNATLKVSLNPKNKISYDFNIVKVVVPPNSTNFYDLQPAKECGNYTVSRVDSLGVIEFRFNKYLNEVSFSLQKNDTSQNMFTFYGILLNNDNPGVTYHALGINGASINSWLKCDYFAMQLGSLNPDWIVIFLGVNDGNSTAFNEDEFYSNYDILLTRIRSYCKQAAITLIVPNDYYLYRKRPNPAVEKEEHAIKQLIEKYNLSMWSLYDIMGGFGSSAVWVRNGLMAADKVHLTLAGYIFSGDMFFNAFLRAYDNHIEKNCRH